MKLLSLIFIWVFIVGCQRTDYECSNASFVGLANNLDKAPFAADVQAYAELGFRDVGVVFTGSSMITLWSDLESRFKAYDAINRGIGGSTLKNIIAHSDVLIFKNRPKAIVLYVGDNDALQYGVAEFKCLFEAFVSYLNSTYSSTALVLISTKPSRSRLQFFDKYIAINDIYRTAANDFEQIYFVDIWSEMFGNEHLYFTADNLHINAAGYDLLVERLNPILGQLID